jgi:dienelactone hydrolase
MVLTKAPFIGKVLILLVFFLGAARTVEAKVKSRTIKYKSGDTTLVGEYFWDSARSAKRPAVLVVHEWWGLNDHARASAKRLAEAGYAAFALDMFGDGKSTSHPEEASAFVAEATKDAAVGRGRFEAALATLVAQAEVDPERVAAIGYCFGGAVVLEMARQGLSLKGVASFHGSLKAAEPAKAGAVKAKVLVAHGAADPLIPIEHVNQFLAEMEAAGADYQFVAYGGAKHGFTNPEADKRGMAALGYNAHADRRSWQALLAFLGEIFS